MIYGIIFNGNLSMLKRVRLTKAVLGSKLLLSLMKIYTAKATVAIVIGAIAHVKLVSVLSRADLIKFVSSLSLILMIIF